MALNKQIHIYNLDTSAFYNENELVTHNKLNKMYLFRSILQKRKLKKDASEELINKIEKYTTNVNRRIRNSKAKLTKEFECNNTIRQLNPDEIKDRNIISIFESSLTRIIGIPTDSVSLDLMVVRTYFFDVFRDIVMDGFLYNGEKYVFFTASAGQIRTKKSVFIKESVLQKYQKTLMCGLTTEDINSSGGVNINKFLAYLALCNSATDEWKDFDIDKTIVVDDMETMVNGMVDFISDKDYSITRKQMDVPISHTDGCGMVLPNKCKKNMMIRLPWIKGLLSPFSFDKFIQENSGNSKIKDIYGKEWDILQDGIEVIFTKSQFKMWKYYADWDTYKKHFKQYHCQAGTCNEERDIFDNAKIGYQMLQTLTDITDDELEYLCHRTKRKIINIGSDRKTMLKTLGVTKANIDKNYLQQAIEIYPELLNDTYCKEILKQVKKSLVTQARAGKFSINGKYTFIIPDLYGFCECLFLGDENPKGLLKNKEVYCKLYRDVEKLDCLRSPHLYREHAVRSNIIDDKKDKWFTTNGLYTSCHDLISKLLMFDVDGDTTLVVADKRFVEIAERNMKDIVPLYYNMAKAGAESVNNKTIYNGIILAYTGGNIGMVSNNITKIWNSDEIDIEAIKLLCMENNFTIDYAKTLYKPKRPKDKNKMISNYTKNRVPHFFIYAKKKSKKEVEEIGNGVIDRLGGVIPNPNINFKAVGLNNFNYKMLMNDKTIDIETDMAKEIIDKHTELDLKKRFVIITNKDKEDDNITYLYKNIRKQILEVNSNINYVVDVLIEYLYHYKSSNYKTTLWSSFGDVIIENLQHNIAMDQVYCEVCGDLIDKTNNRKKYCDECWQEKERELKRDWKRKYDKSRSLGIQS